MNLEKFSKSLLQSKISTTPDFCFSGKEKSGLEFESRPRDEGVSAAQFAPFAALVGYDNAVAETARLTESRPELDEQEQRVINERLAYIADHIHEQPEVRIKYFVPDEYKSGGAIVEASSKVKKISATNGTIVMADGYEISIIDVISLPKN